MNKSTSRRITLYLLTKDRPEMAEEALVSLLAQNFADYQIIISDNSVENVFQELVVEKYSEIKYTRRAPPISAEEHFRAVIRENSSEYFVMFHDDDLMAPEYLATMAAILDAYPNAVAAGCNARMFGLPTYNSRLKIKDLNSILLIKSSDYLASRYFSLDDLGTAPFSGYLYRKKKLHNVLPDFSEAGKYSDVTFLMKILKNGSLVWTPQVLMSYRMHTGNDSGSESFRDRLRLLRYLKSNLSSENAEKIINDYQLALWYRWFRNGNQIQFFLNSRRERILFKYLFLVSFRSILRPSLWRKLLSCLGS